MILLKKYLFYILSSLSLIFSSISLFNHSFIKLKNSSDKFNIFALELAIKTNKKKITEYTQLLNFNKATNTTQDVYLDKFYIENKTKQVTNKILSENQNEIDKILKIVPKYEFNHDPNEETFKITECLFGNSGIKCENFFVNNHANLNIDFNQILNQNVNFKLEKENTPKVLVMHTHTSESYMDKDQGFYYKNTSFRSTNSRRNILLVGEAICSSLENNGIKTIHNSKYHDTPMFTGSYRRSAETVSKILEKNPSIKIILDIHRDTIEYKDKRKVKPTFKINNKKAAQIMIIAGCDKNKNLNHPNWEQNLSFALKLQKKIEDLYPGMTRPLLFTNARYNQHLTSGSILIEVGSDANTLEEAVYSGSLLGIAIARMINNLN